MKLSNLKDKCIPIKEFPRFIFWDRNRTAYVSLSLAMERVIWYGDIEHILKLFKMFDKELIVNTFNNEIKSKIIKKDKALVELIELIIDSF